jgi:hypothetical protein
METTEYYMQEVQNVQSYKNCFDTAIGAISLASAKRVASKHQLLQSTVLKLYADYKCTILLAYKKNGKWFNV